MATLAALDEAFGPLRLPDYLRESERIAASSQVFEFDSHLADELNTIKRGATQSKILRDIALNLCLLWAVDANGRILVGLEVACLRTSVGTHFPRMRGMPLGAAVESLGHPLLVERGAARIAGELFLDENGEELVWTISNKSGRYGLGPDREERHLENVASVFLQAGVPVTTYYLEGR